MIDPMHLILITALLLIILVIAIDIWDMARKARASREEEAERAERAEERWKAEIDELGRVVRFYRESDGSMTIRGEDAATQAANMARNKTPVTPLVDRKQWQD